MKTLQEITKALNVIREAIDSDVVDVDIESIKNKALKLSQLMGLSAETKASAKKLLLLKELIVLQKIDKELAPSVQARLLNAECYEEHAVLEYSDRLNAGIVHGLDVLRSAISLYKQEMASGINNLQT